MAGKKLDEQMEKTIRNNYRRLTGCLIDRKMTITTMESITCGQIASLITDTEGASAILKGAFVTYSNEAKIMQGVPEAVIETCGVYSKETARAMAEACKQAYRADIGIGITGTTGNIDPNNQDSVPGEVYYAVAVFDTIIDSRWENRIPDCIISFMPRRRWQKRLGMCLGLKWKRFLPDGVTNILLEKYTRYGG